MQLRHILQKDESAGKIKAIQQMIALAYGKTAGAIFGKTKKLPAIPL